MYFYLRLLLSCSSDNQTCSYNSFFCLILRDESLDMPDQYISGLFTNHSASLLYRGKHRVARDSTVSISKTTNRYIFRHSKSHSLGCIKNADSRIIINGKESVGSVW